MLVKIKDMLVLLLNVATATETLPAQDGLSIQVHYPEPSASGAPLVVWLGGTTIDPSWGDADALFAEGAVREGFALATLEWPNWDGSDAPGYEASNITGGYSVAQYCSDTADKADLLFGPAEPTSLSVLCALPKIDCSKGVGVAGYSQGAAIGSMAAKIDHRVTAFFGIALNTVGIYRDDGAVEEATCHRDATLSPSARRYLNGGDDVNWAGGGSVPMPITVSGTSYDALEVAKYQLKATSGYDCEKLDCLQSDGSGYFIVPGVNHVNIYPYSWDDMAVGYDMAAYGPTMNGVKWLMARAITDTPGCPCAEGIRRKPLFGSTPEPTCCAV